MSHTLQRPQQPALLSFARPATTWLERLPLGNGTYGVMTDGGLPVTRLSLNHEGGWSGSPHSELQAGAPTPKDAAAALAGARAALAQADPALAEGHLRALQARYSQAFLPMGELTCRLERPEEPRVASSTAEQYSRVLDLSTGVHHSRSGSLWQQVIASAPDGVIAVLSSHRISFDITTPLRVLATTRHDGQLTVLVRFPSDVPPHFETDYPSATWDPRPGHALEGALVARLIQVPSGQQAPQGGWLLLLAMQTTYAGPGTGIAGTAAEAAHVASARLDRAELIGTDALFRRSTHDHRALFERSSVTFVGAAPPPALLEDRLERAFKGPDHPLATDPGLAGLLYDFGRYLLIASARPGGLPPTLQGVWNADMQPAWSSDYTLNINTQMNHWACWSTGLPETAEPLLDLVEALAQQGAATARRLYDCPGWVAHHNSDAWSFTSPVGDGHGQARWSAWPMAGPWLIAQLYSAVEHGSGDPGRLWPLARGAADFALAWHHRSADGRWVTAPATSPENAYLDTAGRAAAVDVTSAMDQQLLHHLFTIVVDLADLVGQSDDPVARACADRRSLLHSEPIVDADGTLREWSVPRVPEDPHHRHLSHLYGLYPGPGRWSPATRQAAVATLTHRTDDSSGWSLIWKTALWARLGRPDKVADLLRLLFRHVPTDRGPEAGGLYPNLFAAHPPFQIDANLGYPAALVEALLHSHEGGGLLRLLPALPPELHTGSARGLIARGGVRVDLSWREGLLEVVEVSSPRPRQVRLCWAEHRVDLTIGPRGVRLTAEDFRAPQPAEGP